MNDDIIYHLIPSDDEKEPPKRTVLDLNLYPKAINLNSSSKMIQTGRLCRFSGCLTYSSFNFKGKKTGHFCSKHKLPGMVHVFKRICQFEGCEKTACFNVPSIRKPIFCSKHREVGMVNIYSLT